MEATGVTSVRRHQKLTHMSDRASSSELQDKLATGQS